ncbi:MAG: BglG family transcription antiterminator [Bacillota bacterium]
MNISSRTKQIIQILCQQKDYTTVETIGNQLDVSSRTILRELPSVEKWLSANGFELETKKGTGVRLNEGEKERKEILHLLNSEKVEKSFTPEERQNIMLGELLLNNEITKLYYFTRMFHVSESTLSHDLDRIEERLVKYQLKLIRKPGLGVYIRGKEKDIRRAVTDIFYEDMGQTEILNLIGSKVRGDSRKSRWTNNLMKNPIYDFMDAKIIAELEALIREIEKQLGYQLADDAYAALIVHLAIAFQRIRNDEKISMDTQILQQLKNTKEFAIASGLAKTMESAFGIEIPPAEIGYITMHLKGSKGRRVLNTDEVSMTEDFKLIRLAKKMIRVAELETGCYLEENEKLLIGLVQHLGPAINRIKLNLDIRNPLLKQIREFYPDLFDVAKKCSQIIEDQESIKVPESEIAYIAMHLGAVVEQKKRRNQTRFRIAVACTSGIGASRLLSSRIEKEFSNLDIVDLISIIDIHEENLMEKGIDFIVATTSIPECEFPFVVVNPLLPSEDQKKLESFINHLQLGKREKRISKETGMLLKEKFEMLNICNQKILQTLEYFKLLEDLPVKDVDSLIQEVCTQIVEGEQKQAQLAADLKNREKQGSTLLEQKEIMLLHCRTKTIEEIHFAVFRPQEPFHIKGMDGSTKSVQAGTIMLAPYNIEKIGLEVLSEITKVLIENDYFSTAILSGTKEDIFNRLSFILGQFYQQKMM